MKIILHPDPRLRQRSIPLELAVLKSDKTQKLIADLKITMKEAKGIGLAAPQVGQNIRIIIVNTEIGPTAFINPRIIWHSLRKELDEEGCLSIPGIYGLVKRHRSVVMNYWDEAGNKQRIRVKGLFARVLQHEIDHLNGILFIDKMVKQVAGGY
ncbi:peptide deformylase [Candidatus Falkowbacteria bacterium]|nr:peptide deformylase [Candidatus Falkowbacteria bacterium]